MCCCNRGTHPCILVHNLQRKHPTGSTFTCSKTLPAAVSFPHSEIEMVFAHLFLLRAHSHSGMNSGGAGTLACVGHEAEKHPIHHGDSKDKHVYTTTNVGFCCPPHLHVCGTLFYFLRSHACIYHDQNTCAYIK